MSPNPAEVNETRVELKDLSGPSGFGNTTAEERMIAAADLGVTAVGVTGTTGPTGAAGVSPTGPTGATGP